jgi:hypothetical protein
VATTQEVNRTAEASPLPRLLSLDAVAWDGAYSAEQTASALQILEAGGIITLPRLGFALTPAERELLPAQDLQLRAKSASYDAATGRIKGGRLTAEHAGVLRDMMNRYARASRQLLHHLFPRYAPWLEGGRTSYRPVEAQGRAGSWRKDDRRLHVDAFPSRPVQDRRLLRVFTNINPDGRPRVWRTGEAFEEVARRYLPQIRRPLPGTHALLHLAGITRSRRSEYDHLMLQLHDRMKADLAYQEAVSGSTLRFAAQSTWVVQTDAVSHAVTTGQYLLEQTFLLPVTAMADPQRSPLRVLERQLGRRLA